MNDDEPAAEPPLLAKLRSEHRELDERIQMLSSEPGLPQLELARLKRRKLALKDQIQALIDASVPDIIA